MPTPTPCHPLDPTLQPVTVIVVAAGRGTRFGGDLPKQYHPIGTQPLLAHTLNRLHDHPLIHTILPVIAPDGAELWQQILKPHLPGWTKMLPPVPGGAERQESVFKGLQVLSHSLSGQAWVAIHDGARPFPSRALLDRLFKARCQADAIIPAIVIQDTIKRIDETGIVTETLNRATLRRIQTPQLFRFGPLWHCHQEATRLGQTATDDAALLEHHQYPVLTVAGEESNLKVTRPEDLLRAQQLIRHTEDTMDACIGQGFDVHRFTPDRPLILGGVTIPHDQGLLGHSDADVLLHAVMDALLGAAGARDIGHHFPDRDPTYRGADSRTLLRTVYTIITHKGFAVVNVDATVICEAPRLAPHIQEMCQNIAQILHVTPDQINVKATTTERLGFTGRREGIAAQAVVMLRRTTTPANIG
ncbi:MAG: bifunctional 2-C-methyl-D-erythritol 4-phosphate cytidylyltransferase/2-C-methyl-D-erythritol 2,4-cyclodiphosphate synthase [Magnetococcales bacterium]|nr:bifunctional 2-C-methyl-D-erythritol 4-phosphate cytidylyltransferase/2-C-methyl-D-erythritol 2,4-cyclodiphosphate synthase [Magnetococcales bacterium]